MAFEDMGEELIPTENDVSVRLPVTFDYSGGRSDNSKTNIITALILSAISIAVSVIIATNDNASIWVRLFVPVAILVVLVWVLRMFIFHEMTYSDAYEELQEVDGCVGVESFWDIFEIDYTYPYICHFRDNRKGIFVKLEKDVVIGKDDDVLFRHYDAISDAYNIASRLKLNMCHIDYMDNIGNDPRLSDMYNTINDCENEELRSIMLSVLGNLQDEMLREYTSYDVYLFTMRGRSEDLWTAVEEVVSEMLSGNFITYRVLDIEGIRSTCMALFNLEDFSAVEACDSVFSGRRFGGIVPISIMYSDGSEEKLNKTQEEIRQELEERLEEERRKLREAEEAKLARKEARKRGKKGVSLTEQADTDLNGINSFDTSGFTYSGVDTPVVENVTDNTLGDSDITSEEVQQESGDTSEDLGLFD